MGEEVAFLLPNAVLGTFKMHCRIVFAQFSLIFALFSMKFFAKTHFNTFQKTFSDVVGLLFGLRLMAGNPTSMPVPPNEGNARLPHLIKTLNFSEMQQMGFKLSAEDIYSVNKSSLKDAVVQLGGFCTAESGIA